MATGKRHKVLCVACRKPAETEYSYDDHRCGVTMTAKRSDGVLIHVSCTNPEGTKSCARGFHYDKFVQVKFELRPPPRAGRYGETRRA
jgi:hypothetical protein